MVRLIVEIVVLILLLVMVFWHAKHISYVCKYCGKDLFTFNMKDGKYMKCPYCHKRGYHKDLYFYQQKIIKK